MNESCVVIVPSPVHSSQRPPLTLKLKVEAVNSRCLAWSVSANRVTSDQHDCKYVTILSDSLHELFQCGVKSIDFCSVIVLEYTQTFLRFLVLTLTKTTGLQ